MTSKTLNVLADRYVETAMDDIWSTENKIRRERLLWILVMEIQVRLGVSIPPEAIQAYCEKVDEIDLDSIRARELIMRHDVMARIAEFNELAGYEFIHMGMTSRDLTEVVEQVQVLESLVLVRDRIVAVLDRLGKRAEEYKLLVIPGRSHNVAAQPITVGKRFAMYADELLVHYRLLENFIDNYPMRGILGPMGTGEDQIELLGVTGLERLQATLSTELCFGEALTAVGQIYPRSLDLAAVGILVNASCALTSFATTVRLMAGGGLMGEGFKPGQVGSSAMPHKKNARSCERICGLGEVLRGHLVMLAGVAGHQWNEGDVSCSVVRRVALPDAFYAFNGMTEAALTVLDELGANPAVIAAEVERFLPFLLTTKALLLAVGAGMGRDTAHEIIKKHAGEVWRGIELGELQDNDLFERLGNDSAYPVTSRTLASLLSNPLRHVGATISHVDTVVEKTRALAKEHELAVSYTPQPIL